LPNRISAPISRGLVADLFLGLISIYLGLMLASGFKFSNPLSEEFIAKITIYFVGLTFALFSTKSWQKVWRWTSADELFGVAHTIIIAATIYIVSQFFTSGKIKAAEPILVSFCMSAFMMGARGFARLIGGGGSLSSLSALLRPVSKGAPAAILIGPTDGVTEALHMIRKEGALLFKPIAIISTSGNHVGKVFSGARVWSGQEIEKTLPFLANHALKEHDNVRIILVGDNHTNETKQATLDITNNTNIKISRMPEVGAKNLSNVNPQDVLGRRRHILDPFGPTTLIQNQTVLITGAGGTIGFELSHQVASCQPNQLILIDSSENNLYVIDNRLREKFPNLEIIPRLVDVRDKIMIEEIFEKFQPKIVLHAAANKHVPLLESHPREAIRVNLGGTKIIADAAMKYKSDIFILISTDKAVNPTNMMGTAKRAAELYIRNCFEKANGRFYSVRFGNVLGSSGSVMPLFEHQISKNGPVTVTHRDMTRWFMTVEEAVGLVLQSAALGGGAKKDINGNIIKLNSPLLVLDMGEPINIMKFAETMIRLRGFEPHTQIKIVETGIRPGEKITEELFYSFESVQDSSIEGIFCAQSADKLSPDLEINVNNAIELAEKNDIRTAFEVLQKIVPQAKLEF
jgi:FlaA1/EpsC-like NDP-sugar epimerase